MRMAKNLPTQATDNFCISLNNLGYSKLWNFGACQETKWEESSLSSMISSGQTPSILKIYHRKCKTFHLWIHEYACPKSDNSSPQYGFSPQENILEEYITWILHIWGLKRDWRRGRGLGWQGFGSWKWVTKGSYSDKKEKQPNSKQIHIKKSQKFLGKKNCRNPSTLMLKSLKCSLAEFGQPHSNMLNFKSIDHSELWFIHGEIIYARNVEGEEQNELKTFQEWLHTFQEFFLG